MTSTLVPGTESAALGGQREDLPGSTGRREADPEQENGGGCPARSPARSNRLLQVVFAGWCKTGDLDLEAVEIAVRGAMHRAGATPPGGLLSFGNG